MGYSTVSWHFLIFLRIPFFVMYKPWNTKSSFQPYMVRYGLEIFKGSLDYCFSFFWLVICWRLDLGSFFRKGLLLLQDQLKSIRNRINGIHKHLFWVSNFVVLFYFTFYERIPLDICKYFYIEPLPSGYPPIFYNTLWISADVFITTPSLLSNILKKWGGGTESFWKSPIVFVFLQCVHTKW